MPKHIRVLQLYVRAKFSNGTKFSTRVLNLVQHSSRSTAIEVLNVKVHVFVLLLFASLPDCSQNQTAVSDTLRLLSDF